MTDLNYELLRVAIAVAGTAFLAWQDARTSFMDERVLYAMALSGLALDLLVGQYDFILSSVGVAAVVFGFGYLFYRGGQLGGGDVWLFTSLQLLLPFHPSLVSDALAPSIASLVPNYALVAQVARDFTGRAYPFLLSVLASSSLFALWGSAIMYAWKLRGRALRPDQWMFSGLLVVLAAALYYFNSILHATPGLSLLLLLLFVPGLFLTSFKRQLLDEVVVQRIPIRKIEDEDILATEYLPDRIVKRYGLGRVLTKSEVEKLKAIERREGIHKFPVCKVLPRFGPYILLGLLASLLVGDVFAFALLL